MNEIDLTALEISTNWYKNTIIQDMLTFEGINLGFLVEWELFHYLIQTIKNYVMLEKILEKEKPQKAIIYGDIGQIGSIFDKHHVTYELKESENHNDDKFIMDYIEIKYDIFNHPVSFRISLQKFFWMRRQYEKVLNMILKLFSVKGKRDNLRKNYLLLEFNPSTYNDLLYAAEKNNNNLKLFNFRRPAIWNVNSFKVILRSGCDIVREYTDKVPDEKIKSVIDHLRNSYEMEKIFSIRNKSFWFFIQKDFINFCHIRFLEALQEIKSVTAILKNQRIDCILGWNDSLQTEKTIMTIGKKLGIQTVVLQHGIVNHNENPEKIRSHIKINGLVPLVADYLCCWGDIMEKHAISLGMQKEKLVKTGSPRYDSFFSQKRMIHVKEKKTILFATSGLANNFVAGFTSEILKKYEESIENICSICQRFKEYELIVKIHPYSSDFIDVKSIIKRSNSNAMIIQNANMEKLIENCDVLITYAQSTVLLEAMILEKPTISIWLYDFISPEEDMLFKYDAVTVTTSERLEDNLKRILKDEDFTKFKINNGKRFVNDYLSNRGKASYELLRFLDQITNNK
ncbi:UDP-N-acetylglucosamine 2-epimerase [Candidatus Nitrosotalea okcheonensis]|uniref:UDP-N-acetylglucosamine 2-epimerase domain-containing protein n=1 Tax=Candidatus Nitrosotalea okcheonensis TaxID=1903276 RepID=A0A2H1FHR6_9ARCH|nr:UDP-N-acetylglucosamine 2-epimerase [Candidatus Nitrosotalea okcheonensis]SMH72311.1 protein of unknown function [Candidatus Nitrosotalea okcheonensis]